MRKPDHTQILKVLNKQVPDRPTLFEFFLNGPLYMALLKQADKLPDNMDNFDWTKAAIDSFAAAGYDYVTTECSAFHFPQNHRERKDTLSMAEAGVITDWESYRAYKWPEPEDFALDRLEAYSKALIPGMKLMVMGPGGVLENVTSLVGYDNLCIMLYDEPELAQQIFNDVGSRLLRYYQMCVAHPDVCAIISNDDWGFKTQTMLSPTDMRKYVFPWHKKIVALAHEHGKPAILHSCGMLEDVMEDVIEDIKFDAKHSYEDTILPIEESYEKYKGRIALLGGIDVGFVCTATPDEISTRCKAMLDRAAKHGGYALGTGNSVPEYVPHEGYFAMIDTIRKG